MECRLWHVLHVALLKNSGTDINPFALCFHCRQASEQQQQLLQQLQQATQQLAAAHATQHKLEQQLQEQAEQHQVVLSDQQAVHDSSSKKLFRELKAAQAAKEQALAGKRVAEQATRCVSSHPASKVQQSQQQQMASACILHCCYTASLDSVCHDLSCKR